MLLFLFRDSIRDLQELQKFADLNRAAVQRIVSKIDIIIAPDSMSCSLNAVEFSQFQFLHQHQLLENIQKYDETVRKMISSAVISDKASNTDKIPSDQLQLILDDLHLEHSSASIAKEFRGRMLLSHAAIYDQPTICELYFQRIKDQGTSAASSILDIILCQDLENDTLLHLAVTAGSLAVVDLFLNHLFWVGWPTVSEYKAPLTHSPFKAGNQLQRRHKRR